jgi:phage protein D
VRVVDLQVNQPQIRVTIGGVAVAGVIAAEIERVAFFAADRFSVTFSVDVSGLQFDYFEFAGKQVTTIELALTAFGYVELLTGQIDNVYSDLLNREVTIAGRDLSAKLIDSEIAETFANQTSSQIATAICARHNFTPNVTPTSTLVGQYYELDHARSALGLYSRGGTEWNLLSWLAGLEGFTLSVFGTTLTFGILPDTAPFLLTLQDCIDLVVDTAASLPTTTIVKSWNSRDKRASTQMAGDGEGTVTTLIRPGLTSQQASTLARNHLATLQTHGTVLLATIPGETSLVPGGSMTLVGTASNYDQNYAIDVIKRSLDAERGFVEHIRAHALS